MNGNIFLWFSPSLSASPHSWPALPLGRVHCGRGLPRRPLHPWETLLLLLFLPAVPQWEVTHRQQRVHVLAGWHPYQHASPGQRRGEPSHSQRRGLWATAAGQYCLIGRWTDRRGRGLYHVWLIDVSWKRRKSQQPFPLLQRGTNCAFIVRRLLLTTLSSNSVVLAGRRCTRITSLTGRSVQ